MHNTTVKEFKVKYLNYEMYSDELKLKNKKIL